MQTPSLSKRTTIRDEQRDDGSTHLSKQRLVLARVVCGVLTALAVGLFVISLPGYVTQLQTICADGACNSGQLSPAALTSLQHLGFSLEQYVAFNVALILIATLKSYAVALLLVLRRSDDWMALLVALMLVYFVPSSITNTVVLSQWVGPAFAIILTSIPGQLSLLLLSLPQLIVPALGQAGSLPAAMSSTVRRPSLNDFAGECNACSVGASPCKASPCGCPGGSGNGCCYPRSLYGCPPRPLLRPFPSSSPDNPTLANTCSIVTTKLLLGQPDSSIITRGDTPAFVYINLDAQPYDTEGSLPA